MAKFQKVHFLFQMLHVTFFSYLIYIYNTFICCTGFSVTIVSYYTHCYFLLLQQSCQDRILCEINFPLQHSSVIFSWPIHFLKLAFSIHGIFCRFQVNPAIYLCQDYKVFWDPLEQEIHSLLNSCTMCSNEKEIRNLDISSLVPPFFPADFSHTSFSQWWDLKLFFFYTWELLLSWRVMATVGIQKIWQIKWRTRNLIPNNVFDISIYHNPLRNKDRDTTVES